MILELPYISVKLLIGCFLLPISSGILISGLDLNGSSL